MVQLFTEKQLFDAFVIGAISMAVVMSITLTIWLLIVVPNKKTIRLDGK